MQAERRRSGAVGEERGLNTAGEWKRHHRNVSGPGMGARSTGVCQQWHFTPPQPGVPRQLPIVCGLPLTLPPPGFTCIPRWLQYHLADTLWSAEDIPGLPFAVNSGTPPSTPDITSYSFSLGIIVCVQLSCGPFLSSQDEHFKQPPVFTFTRSRLH